MSVKFYENALKALKKANKARKMVLAGRAGYSEVSEYQAFLEANLNGTTAPEPTTPTAPKPSKPEGIKMGTKNSDVLPVIYVADVIDCSGSMRGSRIKAATKGFNDGLRDMRKETKVGYKHLVCDFACSNDINFTKIVNIAEARTKEFDTRGVTALNDAIIKTIEMILSVKGEDEKGLINVYTDGGENGSVNSTRKAKEVIKIGASKGITLTFIGTERDTKSAIQTYNIDSSNTQVYDGTADGLGESMILNSAARSSYADKVSKGLDVSKGFFKDVNK